MMPEALGELVAICRKSQSFGSNLYNLLIEQNVSQKELAYQTHRSKSDVSRLINDEISEKMRVEEVEQIAVALKCDDVQLAKLVRAFVCHVLRGRGLW